jgi:drug/metabolite transporter (DMT)-like permease
MAAFLALISSLMWGTADFFGGFVSKKIPANKVLVLSYPVGFLFLLIYAFMLPGEITMNGIVVGTLAGIVGILAMGSLYLALAIGPMGVMSPVTAASSTFVPIAMGLIVGENLSWIAWTGIGIAIVSVVLVSMETSPTGGRLIVSGKGLILAITSGLLIGTFLSLVGLASSENGMWPLVFARLMSSLLVLTYFIYKKTGRFSKDYNSKLFALVIISGALDATANALFVLATFDGYLSIAAVIASLYPAATVILATAFLKERLTAIQFVGIALAFFSAAILSLV